MEGQGEGLAPRVELHVDAAAVVDQLERGGRVFEEGGGVGGVLV